MAIRRQPTPLEPDAYEALILSAENLVTSPWALDDVRYALVNGNRMLELCFAGAEFSVGIPLASISELARAKTKDLQTLRLSPAGDTIIADRLDAHISVEGLLKQLSRSSPTFTRLVSTLFAGNGGKKSSEKKRQSSAENGRKGGRPRKLEELQPA